MSKIKESGDSKLEALIAEGALAEAVAYAGQLHKQGGMDANFAQALLAHARSWHVAGHFDLQQQACEMVLAVLPEHFEALHLLGFIAQTRGEYEAAETCYTRALVNKPDYAFAKLALAQIRMMRTEFREGRNLYEARFDAVTEASGPDWRGLPIARWKGESLKGKRLYLWAEQGLGDIVMFASLLPNLLAQSPACIALGMFPKLISLFARSFPVVAVESIDDAAHHALGPTVLDAFPQIEKLAQFTAVPFSLEPLRAAYDYTREHGLFDYAAPLGDLLVHCLPAEVPARRGAYLMPDPARLAAMRARLGASGKGKRIGISWHTDNTREVTRNIPLQEWLPLFATPDCRFISLQHRVPKEEITRFCKEHNCNIYVDDVDLLQDAEGLAALIASMDEVITIDNSTVHLAGALGVKTTLLLPKGCNYRWGTSGEHTLWYKSVTLMRQRELMQWREVIAQLCERLKGAR